MSMLLGMLLPCLVCQIDPAMWVGAIGAAIVIGSSMVTGWRLEQILGPYIPWWPGDVGAVGGLIVGTAIVVGWLL